MVHWSWLIAAFIVGGMFGVLTMCLIFVAGKADERINKEDAKS